MKSQKGLGRWDMEVKLKDAVFCLELPEYGREEFSEAASIPPGEQSLNLRIARDDRGQRKSLDFLVIYFFIFVNY